MALTETQQIEKLEAEVAFLKQELGLLQHVDERAKVQRACRLTRQEADVLLALYERKRPVPKEAMLTVVWGLESDVGVKIVDVVVCKLRRKLGSFDTINTIWGVGYELSEAGRQLVKDALDSAQA